MFLDTIHLILAGVGEVQMFFLSFPPPLIVVCLFPPLPYFLFENPWFQEAAREGGLGWCRGCL